LVKNFYLTPKRTFSRKAKEALMALLLEIRYSKEQILEAYLNEIYFGQRGSQGIYGVGEAAEFYFGKPVRKLALEESAFLAGLIRSPNLYSPHKNTERILKRRDGVLKKMWGLGMISEEQYNEATKTPVEVRAFHPEQNDAPYFVDYLVKELEKEYSLDILTSEGLLIYTTLDVEMQNQARRAVKEGLARLEARYPALKSPSRDDPEQMLQACLVAIEPQTGFVRAMIGGRDYKKSQFNRVVQARRQPGSLFKPIVYATALEGGAKEPAFTAASLVRDEPISIRYEGKSWSPSNFNDQFFGQVTVRTALENSLNCATVWLSQRTGLEEIIETAQRLGLASPMEPTPSLVLGAFETQPLEMASAFGAFANHGVLARPRAIKKVLDHEGRLLERRPMELKQAVSPEDAYVLTSLLQGVFERGTARSVSGKIRVPAAGKTGTTNDSRDAWFAGYTPRLAALVWVGFDKPHSIGRSGSQAALPIWADFIRRTSDWLVTEDFVPPPGVVFQKIDRISGLLATRLCTETITEVFLEGTEPTESCPLHPDDSIDKGIQRKKRGGVFRRFLDRFR
jgi:penicillin-binding protein 1B